MNYKVLELKKFFLANYKLHPSAVMEYDYVAPGEDDQSKRKATLSFVKRMTALSDPLEKISAHQQKLFYALNDFDVLYKLGANEVVYYVLANLYSVLDKTLKEFSKELKKNQNQPEIVEFFKNAEPYLNQSGYAMMKEDFEMFEPVTTERLNSDKKRFPNHTVWMNPTPDMEKVNEIFKKTK